MIWKHKDSEMKGFKICEDCGIKYKPLGNAQKKCDDCRKLKEKHKFTKETKLESHLKNDEDSSAILPARRPGTNSIELNV